MKHILSPLLLLLALSVHAQFGVLDPSFGGDGIVQTVIGNASMAQGVAVQADGKILVAGNSDSSAVIVRYMPDGSLDASFGSGGIAVLEVWDITALGDIAVQSDGKIVVCGRTSTAPYSDFLLARFDADGSLDLGFGQGGSGYMQVDFAGLQSSAVELAIQPDGKIVLAGWNYSPTTSVRIMRFTAAGLTDTGNFGTSAGTSTFNIPGALAIDVRGMALQPDGKILFAGTVTEGSNTDRYAARMLNDGSIDAGFGTGGVVHIDAGTAATERGSDVVLQADGKILVVAYVATSDQHVQVTRLLANGTVDSSYGIAGEAIGIPLNGDVFTQQAIVQGDGKLVLVGHYNDGTTELHAVWRINTNGTFDATFGTGGMVLQPFGTANAFCFDAAEQADGKLLICGQSPMGGTLATARLTSGQGVGVEELSGTGSFVIHPDPVDRSFTITCDAITAGTRIVIIDESGRSMDAAITAHQGVAYVDVSRLAHGTYVVILTTPRGTLTGRFVKH